jgi:Ca-activated chloride channel family protein
MSITRIQVGSILPRKVFSPSMFRNLSVLVTIGSLLALALPAQAQQPPSLNESVSVGYVMVPFTPLDGKGRVIRDLARRDVRLAVEGRTVRTDLFERSENAPASFTILFDGSGSMALAGKMDAARAAVEAILDQRREGDDFSMYVFAESAASEVVPFTQDADAIRRALRQIKPYGKTAFFDALSRMPEQSRLGRNPTRAIILLSDGIDNASLLTREALEKLLEGVTVPVYSLGLRDAAGAKPKRGDGAVDESATDLAVLEEIAEVTGGRMTIGTDPLALRQAIMAMGGDLRAQYLVGFTPTSHGDVRYRRMNLLLPRRVHSVRVRSGYRGTEPPVVAASGARVRITNTK